jgi:hypothetical protein
VYKQDNNNNNKIGDGRCACDNADDDDDDDNNNSHVTLIKTLLTNNQQLRYTCRLAAVHATLYTLALALYPLGLPAYVLLEIADRLPYLSYIYRRFKLDTIVGVLNSCDRIVAARQLEMQTKCNKFQLRK